MRSDLADAGVAPILHRLPGQLASTNSGFGVVISYSASQAAVFSGQVVCVPDVAAARGTLPASTFAGLPPVTLSVARVVEYVQFTKKLHSTITPGSPLPDENAVIVPMPLVELAWNSTFQGVFSGKTVHFDPNTLSAHPVKLTAVISPVTVVVELPALVVLPEIVEPVHETVPEPAVRTATVPLTSVPETDVPEAYFVPVQGLVLVEQSTVAEAVPALNKPTTGTVPTTTGYSIFFKFIFPPMVWLLI
ncbi:MAG: hypothetical protein ACTHN3_02985 [Solirubrobacterales bacterium]